MSQNPKTGQNESPVNRNVVLATLVSGAFVVILNQTLLNTAIPAFMKDFGIAASTAQWVTTIFMLVNGIMIPVTAFLIQKFTTRGLFLTAMTLFIVGTLTCALAPVYPVLLAGRVIQAASGGLIIPLMQTILFAIFPVEKRGAAMGTFGLVISFAPAIGPSLSGWVVDHLPWEVLFYLMLPIALIDIVIAYFILRNVTERTYPKLDVLSIILSSFGFGGLLLGLGGAGDAGWLSPEVYVPLAIGLVTLLWFIRRQFKLREPMLEFRVLQNRMFTLNTALGMLVFIAMIGGMLIIPVFMQDMTRFSALQSGLALLPGAVIMGLMSPVTGRIFDAVGARLLAVPGFVLLTGATFMFARLNVDTSFWYITIVNAVRMLGTAMVMMPVTTAALNQLPSGLIPHGTALNNTFRQISASVGTAVLVTVMVGTGRDPEVFGASGPIHGANVAFFVAGCVSAIGIIGAFFSVNSHGPDQRASRRSHVD
jgi:EmrB/QacA subfamily drug resistance transporter